MDFVKKWMRFSDRELLSIHALSRQLKPHDAELAANVFVLCGAEPFVKTPHVGAEVHRGKAQPPGVRE